MNIEDEYNFHTNKKPGKTYISKRISRFLTGDRIRFASKVFDGHDLECFAKIKTEQVIRITESAKQEIVAIFYEDSRNIESLIIQRFTLENGMAHKNYFSFKGEEIDVLKKFIDAIELISLESKDKINISDNDLSRLIINENQAKKLITENQKLFLSLLKSEITNEDVVSLGYRKKELKEFDLLLHDREYYESKLYKYSCTPEGLWQKYFEKNKWIFGYGLGYVFLTELDGKKLEQVVQGFDLKQHGKRSDAVMKTRGIISSLCFVEIKTPNTPLLQDRYYRKGCWSPSNELSGAISQIQGTVSRAIYNLSEDIEFDDDIGNPTGEKVFNYAPKSFLIVGSLNEFIFDGKINKDKYRSFELLRRNMVSPEILTYDELYERAQFIIDHMD